VQQRETERIEVHVCGSSDVSTIEVQKIFDRRGANNFPVEVRVIFQ